MPKEVESSAARSEVASWVKGLEVAADISGTAGFDPADVLAKILSATTFEDAIDAQETSLVSAQDLKDVPFMIHFFDVRKSNKADASIPVYLVVNATNLETGEDMVFGVGAPMVVATLWQADKFGRLPGTFTIKGKETSSGNELLLLKPFKAVTVKG